MAYEFYVKDSDILSRTNGTKVLLFKDFAGTRSSGSYASDFPNFNAVITEDCANRLIEEGYYVKSYEDADGNVMYRLKVTIRFDKVAPKIYKKCGKKLIKLNEETLKDLDRDEIIGLGMKISLSKKGRTYLNAARFEIEEDEFEKLLYEDVDEDEEFDI